MDTEFDKEQFGRLSPYEQACEVRRLTRDTGMTRDELSALVGRGMNTISKLMQLEKLYSYLPAGWQEDLRVRRRPKPTRRPAIKYSHWTAICSFVGKGGLSKELFDLLEQARAGRWTMARLKEKAVKLVDAGDQDERPVDDAPAVPVVPVTDEHEDEPEPVPKVDTVAVLRKALKYILRAKPPVDTAAETVRPAFSELAERLENVGEELTTIEQEMRALTRALTERTEETDTTGPKLPVIYL